MSVLRRAIKPAVLAVGASAIGLRSSRAPVKDFTSDSRGPDPGSVRRVLVWTMNSLGDVLRATPALAALRRRYPAAHIAMVAAGRAAPILRANPNIDRLIEIRDAYRVRQHLAAIGELAGQAWDLGVLLEVNACWTTIEGFYLRWLGVPQWACFDFGSGVARRAIGVPLLPDGSWADQFNHLVSALGADARDTQTEIHLLPEERQRIARRLRAEGLEEDQPFFLVHPGGNMLEISRRWPADSFAALLDAMWRRWPWPVVLTGTAPEQDIVDSIVQRTEAPVIDLCGTLSMRELAASIERASLCVMNDTGPLHMAQALRRPTVAILGPTDPSVVGVAETTEAVRLDLPCSPCARYAGWRACSNPNRLQCLHDLAPEQVFDAVERLMSPRPRRRRRLPVLDAEPQLTASSGGVVA